MVGKNISSPLWKFLSVKDTQFDFWPLSAPAEQSDLSDWELQEEPTGYIPLRNELPSESRVSARFFEGKACPIHPSCPIRMGKPLRPLCLPTFCSNLFQILLKAKSQLPTSGLRRSQRSRVWEQVHVALWEA